VGSHGSYNDNGVGTSYGSYGGHSTNNPSYYSPLGPGGFNLHGQVGGFFLGSSPDIRRRPQLPHNNPNGGLGLSPSNLGPMSLGASPSQFTPPNSHSHMQIIPAASPGRYGPTSPVRGAHNSSSLGKQAAVGQYNKRWSHLPASMPHYDHGHGHYGDGPSTSHHHHHDGSSRGFGYSHSMLSHSSPSSNWRQRQQQQVTAGTSTSASHEVSVSNSFAQDSISGHSEIPVDAFESTSIPDPADWDPNYRFEALIF
jgi:dual specificity protein kinase YAK1